MSAVDRLQVKPIVAGLAALLNDKATTLPLTIAISAPWGAGKSAVMLQLKEYLCDPSFRRRPARSWIPVDFSAWKYDKTERVWAALAKSIYDQAQCEMSWFARLAFRIRLERRRRGLPTFLAIGLGPPILAVLLMLAAVSGNDDKALDSYSVLGALILVVISAGAAVARYWGVVSQPFKRAIDSHSKHEEYVERLSLTAEASNDVDALCDVLLRRDDSALIVCVDDLDRCASRDIVEVVEAVSRISSVQERRCVFVLGMDLELVGSSLGESLLSKTVQITLTLPALGDSALRTYLAGITGHDVEDPRATSGFSEDAVEKVEVAIEARGPRNPADVFAVAQSLLQEAPLGTDRNVIDEAIRRAQARRFTTESPEVARAELEVLGGPEQDPRQVKRFDIAFRLQLHVASNTPGTDQRDFTLDQLVALGKWVALRLRWPEISAALDQDPDALDRLEGAVNAGSGAEGVPAEWLQNADIRRLLDEPRNERRVAALSLRTSLRVT